MKFKFSIICIIFFVILISITTISASDDFEINQTLEDNSYNDLETDELSEINRDNVLNSENDMSFKNSEIEEINSSSEIYIGLNEEDGNGSKENPFKNFELACNSIKEQQDNLSIKVFNGTYELGSILKFNVNNLHIEGIGDQVIIKNQYNIAGSTKTEGSKQIFSISSLTGNFTMSNIIVDATGWTQSNTLSTSSSATMQKKTNYFYMFYNTPDSRNNVLFDNCTFVNCLKQLPRGNNIFLFNNCKFYYNSKVTYAGAFWGYNSNNVTFEYCLFDMGVSSFGEFSASIINCWIGQNSPDLFLYYQSGNGETMSTGAYLNKYAQFTISEEKIDDNTYDIIGKLMWNDTTTDGIENLAPMTVTLTSQTGEIPSTATLENGMFKVRYTTNAKEHNITAKLDSEELKLVFNYNVDIAAEAKPINYGDDQNITINLPYNASGIIKLTFEDETSEEIQISELSSLNYTIKKVLKAGINKINVSLIDEDSHSYGSTVIDYTISKISDYTLDIDMPKNVTVGDTVEITVSLPDGATGNLTVKVGDNEAKTFNVNETIIINGFVAGDNAVNVTYNGNDIYDVKSVVKTVVASTKPTALAASDVTTTYNVTKELVITLTSNGDALVGKTINVVVGTINKNLITNASGQVSLDISSLTPDTYTANIAFAGDNVYNKSSTTAKVTVKEEIKTNITIPEIVAGKATTTTITLPQNATGNITVIVDGNVTGVENLTNGSATVIIPELSAGKHNITISYSGDDNYAGFAQTSAVEVKEPAKPTTQPDNQKSATTKKTATKITAKKKTFKAKTKVKKYTITLKAGKKAVKKVQVILKIGKKTYKAKTNAKGKATFKIKKLTKKGKYNAKITFKGNKLYKATTKKVKITVKK